MLRWLYIQLIWLHPAPFRWRFGDDMLDDFDRGANRAKLRYFSDAVASLARQWLLRPEFRHPDARLATVDARFETTGVPLFQTIATYQPRPAALLHGSLLAIVAILTPVLLIGKGIVAPRAFLIGVYASRHSLLPTDRNSVVASDLNAAVKVAPDPFEAWLNLARHYFVSMPVLRALDVDHDLALSPWEIRNAPMALRQLDTNHEGRVTAEECGLHVDLNSVPVAMQAQLHQRFMNSHPVLATLDANHDGEISASEVERAADTLKQLDRNSDGYLTANEFIPFVNAYLAGLR
jgi:hypothetical protein